MTKSKSIIIIHKKSNLIGQLGRSDTYNNLNTSKKECKQYIKTNYPSFKEFPKIVQDHLWNEFFRQLINCPLGKNRCVTTTYFLNSARKYAKKGQTLN